MWEGSSAGHGHRALGERYESGGFSRWWRSAFRGVAVRGSQVGEGLDLCVPESESHLDSRDRGPPSQPKAGRWNWVNDLISEGLRISVFASKAFESPGRNPCPACPRSHLFSLAV